MENKNVSNFTTSAVYELNAEYFVCPVSRANEGVNSQSKLKSFNTIFDATVKSSPPKLSFCYYDVDRIASGFVCQLNLTEEIVKQHFENDVNLFINDDSLKVYGRHFGRAMKYGVVIDEGAVVNDVNANGFARIQLRYYVGTSMLIGNLKVPVVQRSIDCRILALIMSLSSHIPASSSSSDAFIPASPTKVVPVAAVEAVPQYDNLEDVDVILNNETVSEAPAAGKSKATGNKRRRIGGTNLMPMKQK